MNDRTIASGPVFPYGVALWGCLAAVAFSVGLASGNVQYAVAALPACALAVGLATVRPASFRCEAADDGLRLPDPDRVISYDSIQSATIAGMPQEPREGRLKVGPVMVMHRDGVLEIPRNVNADLRTFYRDLLTKVCGSGSRDVNPQLDSLVKTEEGNFGPDRVWTFRSREHLGRRPSTRRGRVCSLLLMLAGLGWTVLSFYVAPGNRRDPSPWLVFGILLIFIAFLNWIRLKAKQRHPDARLRGRREASLVVSPTGIAMIQGAAKGQMRWDELRDVVLSAGPRRFRLSTTRSRPGLQLVVEGAVIRIADIYDRPLPVIAAVIRRLWRGAE